MGFVIRHKERVKKLSIEKPEISIFNFREPGDRVNKIKYWDNSIIIDKDKQILKLLFKKRSICGNSIMIMPDRRFIYIRSDSHEEILGFNHSKVALLLDK